MLDVAGYNLGYKSSAFMGRCKACGGCRVPGGVRVGRQPAR